jgi:hypothetical protein
MKLQSLPSRALDTVRDDSDGGKAEKARALPEFCGSDAALLP